MERIFCAFIGLMLAFPSVASAQAKRAFEIQTRFERISGLNAASVRFPGGLAEGQPGEAKVDDLVGLTLSCVGPGKPAWKAFVRVDHEHRILDERRMTVGVVREDGMEAKTIGMALVNQTLNTAGSGADVIYELATKKRAALKSVAFEFGFARIYIDAGTLLYAMDVAGSYCRNGRVIDNSNPY